MGFVSLCVRVASSYECLKNDARMLRDMAYWSLHVGPG